MRKVRSILCFNVAGPVTIGVWFVARVFVFVVVAVVIDDDDAGDEYRLALLRKLELCSG